MLKMMLNAHSPEVLIIAIVVIVLFFAIFAILQVFFGKRRMIRQVQDLKVRYEKAHNLLVSQDSSYLQRIASIASSNLLYGATYQNYEEFYTSILNKEDKDAWASVGVLQDALEKKQTRGLKDLIKKSKEVVGAFEARVKEIDDELKNLFADEEKWREKSLEQKERLRQIKNCYFEQEVELRTVSDSFDTLFQNIDEAFKNFDSKLDEADYDAVGEILQKINDVLCAVQPVLNDLPTLCALMDEVIPEKMSLVREEYNKMNGNGYPTHHLGVITTLERMESELKICRSQLQSLSIKGIREQLNQMVERLDQLLSAFQKEKDAKMKYDLHHDAIYNSACRLDQEFINICNVIPQIQKIYLIEDEHLEEIQRIKNALDGLGTIKRTLDNYSYSNTKQPYSILLEKVQALDSAAVEIKDKMENFKSYLLSLETERNQVRDLIYDSYFRLKKCAKSIRDINVPTYTESLKTRFEDCYSMLDEMDKTLKISPINITHIIDVESHFKEVFSSLMKEIEEKNSMAYQAESMIVYCNRDRHSFNDMKNFLAQVEVSFFDGEFGRAFKDAGNIFSKVHEHAKSSK